MFLLFFAYMCSVGWLVGCVFLCLFVIVAVVVVVVVVERRVVASRAPTSFTHIHRRFTLVGTLKKYLICHSGAYIYLATCLLLLKYFLFSPAVFSDVLAKTTRTIIIRMGVSAAGNGFPGHVSRAVAQLGSVPGEIPHLSVVCLGLPLAPVSDHGE